MLFAVFAPSPAQHGHLPALHVAALALHVVALVVVAPAEAVVIENDVLKKRHILVIELPPS